MSSLHLFSRPLVRYLFNPVPRGLPIRFTSSFPRPAPRPTHSVDDAAIGAGFCVLGYGMLVLAGSYTCKDDGYCCWIGPGDGTPQPNINGHNLTYPRAIDRDRWKTCIAEEAKFLKLYEEKRAKGKKGESEKLLKRALRFRADREDLERRAKQITTAARLRNKEEKASKEKGSRKRPDDERRSVPDGMQNAEGAT